MYQTENGAKPRYDGGGSEFGAMHRDLGQGYLMFDIDRLSVGVEMRRENECFTEVRFSVAKVEHVAMFEIKHKRTPETEKALDAASIASIVRLDTARKLACRLFVVFATDGQQPFSFHEIDTETGEQRLVGILDYDATVRAQQCRKFWNETLGITRDSW